MSTAAPIIEKVTGFPPRTNLVNGSNTGTTAPAQNPHGKGTFKRIALAALIAVAGFGLTKFAYDWATVGRFIESTDDAYVGGDVTVMAPKVPGLVSQVAVTDNQRVHAGDLLIKLDDREYIAALDKAKAAVAIERALLRNLDATRHLQEAVVAQAASDIAASDAEIVRTRDDQARYKSMAASGAASPQRFEKADADFKLAAAIGDKSHAALMAAQRQLEVIGTQKEQAQAALDAAIAGQNLAELNLSFTELRAPIDGIVGNRSAQIGAFAPVGAQLIAIVPAHGLWIDANFKENQLANIRPGSSASVKIDLLGGKSFKGHVVSIAPATGAQFSVLPAENATGNFTKIVQRIAVRIVLDGKGPATGELRPGLSVTAKVDIHSKGSL